MCEMSFAEKFTEAIFHSDRIDDRFLLIAQYILVRVSLAGGADAVSNSRQYKVNRTWEIAK